MDSLHFILNEEDPCPPRNLSKTPAKLGQIAA